MSYPRLLPGGWGQPPWRAVLVGLAHVAVGVMLLRIVGPLVLAVVDEVRDGIGDSGTGDNPDGAAVLLAVVLLFVGAGAVLVVIVLVRGVGMLLSGVPDLLARRTVEGRVLRLRIGGEKKPTYVAVDEGTDDRLRAWVVSALPAGLRQGDTVRATISPRLRWVERLERVTPPPG